MKAIKMKCRETMIMLALLGGLVGLVTDVRAENLLAGITGYTFSAAPNGPQKDSLPTAKLTDTIKLWQFIQLVQWNLSALPGQQVEITLDSGSLQEMAVFNTYWVRWDTGAPLPDEVTVLTSTDGAAYNAAGVQTVQISKDQTVCVLSLALSHPVDARYVRFRIQRATAGTVSLAEVEALQPAQGNMAIGYPYDYSISPNGSQTDPARRKLTDGLTLFDLAQTVQWDCATLSADPQITIALDRPTSLTRVATWWYRDEAKGLPLPEIVNLYVDTDGQGFRYLGTMAQEMGSDRGLNRLAWQGAETRCSRLAVVFNRGISRSGVVSLAEIDCRGTPLPLEAHNQFGQGFVLTLTAGSDVFFRPENHPDHIWSDPPSTTYAHLARALHDNYYANTLYIEYNGEVDRQTALEYYRLWGEACADCGMEMVPIIGLVQWDYLKNVNPAAEYGTNFYWIAPMVDLKNTQARVYFRDFVRDLLTTRPDIKRLGATDINQFALACSIGYPFTLADLRDWTEAVLADAADRRWVGLFEQPRWTGAGELNGVPDRVCDTYGYLLNETYGDLQRYIAGEVAGGGRVDGDLVIVTDPGGRMEPAVNVLAARAIEAAGGGLTQDLIITTAIIQEYPKESFWFSLLDDGFYQGWYERPFEAVRQRFRLHHGPEPATTPKSATHGGSWRHYH